MSRIREYFDVTDAEIASTLAENSSSILKRRKPPTEIVQPNIKRPKLQFTSIKFVKE